MAILVIAVCLAPCLAWPKATAFVKDPVFDAGDVFQGKVIMHGFIFTNTGDQRLILSPKHC